MLIAITHEVRYRFDEPVRYGMMRLRLRPREGAGQQVVDWSTAIEGAGLEVEYQDQNQNHVALVGFGSGGLLQDDSEVVLRCNGTVDTRAGAGVAVPHAGFMPLWLFLAPTDMTKPGVRIMALARQVAHGSVLADTAQAQGQAGLMALGEGVRAAMTQRAAGADAPLTAEQALAAGAGTSVEFAQVFVAAARLLGYPARYVAGYRLADAAHDSLAEHSWAEAHVAGEGWVGYDSLLGQLADERYVQLGVGMDHDDALPGLSMAHGSVEAHLSLSVQMQAQAAMQ